MLSLRSRHRAVPVSALAFIALGLAACSDPATVPFQGAFTATFGNAATNVCPATSPTPTVGAGSVTANARTAVVDGENGAAVSCTVVAADGKFNTTATISLGSVNFSLSGVSFTGNTGTGTVAIGGPNTVGIYRPAAGSTCNFELISADAGRMWTKFSCPNMVRGATLNSLCAVSDGVAVFENCLDK